MKIETNHDGVNQNPWTRKHLPLHTVEKFKPDFVVDISEYFDAKIKSVSF